MKTRAMKKWIPKGCYCYDKNGKCKWWHFLGWKEWNKENCEFAETCKNTECNCRTSKVYCEYLKLYDEEDDSFLWDMCKECGEHEEW